MKYTAVVLSVADVKAARGFYEDLFGLEVCQDYGINVSFTCGLSLQQEFDWLVGLPKESVLKKSNNIELCFEEEDFDGFLKKLERMPDIVSWAWWNTAGGSGWCAFTTRTGISLRWASR